MCLQAMKDYIMSQNTVRPVNLKHLLRKALAKLLEKEAIIRPKGEENKVATHALIQMVVLVLMN